MGIIYKHAQAPVPLLPARFARYQMVINMMMAKHPEDRIASAAGNRIMALVPEAIDQFLVSPTPDAWLEEAASRIPELLLDHANCELKAASTALGFCTVTRIGPRSRSECPGLLGRSFGTSSRFVN